MGRCFLLKWHDGVEVRAAGSLDVFKFFLENYILLPSFKNELVGCLRLERDSATDKNLLSRQEYNLDKTLLWAVKSL